MKGQTSPTGPLKPNKLHLDGSLKVALVYRPETAKALSLAKKVTEFLKKKGVPVLTAPEQKVIPGTQLMKSSKAFDSIGLVIVLGGDGTYLRAVRLLGLGVHGRSVPILGFNMGSLGFLTAHSADSVFEVIQKTLDGKMELRPRAKITARIFRKGKMRAEFHALNDMVIERGSLSHLITTSIYSEKFLVSEVKADAFIIASPSGSTAYNLAAGGPILHPESAVFVVTPVAPHSLTSRPLIFPDDRELSFKLSRTPQADFIVDGQKQAVLKAEDEVVIRRCECNHWIVREPSHNFFHLLREKLKFGDRS